MILLVVLLVIGRPAAAQELYPPPPADRQLAAYLRVIEHVVGWYPAPKPTRLLLYARTSAICDYACLGRPAAADPGWPRVLLDSLRARGIQTRVCERGQQCSVIAGEIIMTIGLPARAQRGYPLQPVSKATWLGQPRETTPVAEVVDLTINMSCGAGPNSTPNCRELFTMVRYYLAHGPNRTFHPFAYGHTGGWPPSIPSP
ncbi:MAG TPA: hypothetical protein VFS20_14995 [Longimicrobium sp.]|nr:hypothetical protein [Longimicrobium sp.]